MRKSKFLIFNTEQPEFGAFEIALYEETEIDMNILWGLAERHEHLIIFEVEHVDT